MDTVFSFSNLHVEQRPFAGGKGATLAQLYQAGYSVPAGFVILPTAFADNQLKTDVWQQVQQHLAPLRHNSSRAFAVRSSALSEDSAQASFAGEFETVLNARSDSDIQAAIHTVHRSRLSERVQAYSQAKGMTDTHETAVIVQQMIPAEMSGVLFTADPVSGSHRHMTGNFVHGLGDQLVSGEVSGESFILQRPNGRYHGPQALKRYGRRLFKLAGRLEKELGGPQDIEWAVADGKLYLLQSRPITTLIGHNPATGEWNDSLTGDYLWSNVNVGEAFSDVMTPYTWSMIKTVFAEMDLLPGYCLYGNIGGRPYNNVNVTITMLRALGKNVQDMANEFGGGMDKFPEGMALPQIPLPRSAFFPILGRAVRMLWKQWWALKTKDRFLADNPDWCQRMVVQARATQTKSELRNLWWGEIAAYGYEIFWLLIAGTYQYTERVGKLRRHLVKLVGREDADLLLSNVSSETELLASLGPVVGLWQVYHGKISREAFLSRYGHRGPHEGEYSYPRPMEDPAWLDQQLAAFAQSPVDVPALLAQQKAQFTAAWTRFQASQPRRTKSIRRRLVRAAAAARLREAVRSEVVRFAWVSRVCALRAGELTGLGDDVFFLDIDELDDVLQGRETAAPQAIPARKETYERYKALPPYPAVINGRFDPFQWAADPRRRSDLFDAHAHAPAQKLATDVAQANRITGSPGSAGSAEGTVRLLDRVEDGDQLQAGEILVAVQTNIGWTLLFPRAAAVVTDVGAPLSHAAIVARELGIPAVVGCGDATMRLKTGDRVRINGSKGIVELLEA